MTRTLWTLFLIFVVLKFTGNITWSWIWVFAPLWGPVALIAPIFTYFLIKEIQGKEDVHYVK